MSQQVGLKVQLASDFGKLSTIGLGAVVKLVNRVDELEKVNTQLQEALKFYAARASYEIDFTHYSDIAKDNGNIARQALEETK